LTTPSLQADRRARLIVWQRRQRRDRCDFRSNRQGQPPNSSGKLLS
jgi:hypothetical protein